MIPIVKLVLAVATALVLGFAINSTLPNRICVDNNPVRLKLRTDAQEALNSIGSERLLTASEERASRGQHVFNNGLLKFHRSVLRDLLEDVGGSEQLENLGQDLIIPLNQNIQNAIRTMVASFRSNELYVDYNANVFGEFVRQLRKAIVEYLKAETSVTQNGRYRIRKMRWRVRLIATQMVNHDVYVDPMARDRWLQEHPGRDSVYNQSRNALQIMFQNILQDFQKVSDKIRVFRGRNNWNWNSDLK